MRRMRTGAQLSSALAGRFLSRRCYISGGWQAAALQRVHWGAAASALAEEVAALGASRAFIIASQTLRSGTDEIAKCEAALGANHAGTWSGMRGHTPREDVLSAAAAAREAGADLLVSIGGGSVTDGTKAVNLCLDRDVRTVAGLDRYVGQDVFGPDEYAMGGGVRQVAVPTTLSAGEFTRIVGVTNKATEHKELFAHTQIQPCSVIFDPELSLHTPEWLWLSTGIRSVDHATEALCSINANPYSSSVAAAALRLLAAALPKTKANPHDLQARLECQIGCWQAVSTVMMGVHYGASHAIGHVLGGTADVPHGYTSCINLPYVLQYNAEAIPGQCRAVADALGAGPGETAAEAMDALIRGLGMPRTLSDVDFPEGRFEQVCELSMKDPWTLTNPRPITSPDDVRVILEMARDGVPNSSRMAQLRG